MRYERGSILMYGLLALAILSVLSGISYSIYNAGVTAEKSRWETAMREAKEKEEATQREIQRRATSVMDATDMLQTFVQRFGHLEEFAPVVSAIQIFLKGI